MMKLPKLIAKAKYEVSSGNCCTRIFESQCGITYRTNS